MDDGLPKQAARYSKVLAHHKMSFLLTAAQYTSFLTWWKTTAGFGSLWFNFVEPIAGATVDGRLVGGEFQATPLTVRQTHYKLDVTVEAWI